MITTEQFVEALERNVRLIRMQTDGLSHADSLLQMPFRANCMNWVVGHFLANRDSILKSLGEDPLLTEEELEVYKRESEPIIEERQDVIHLERMLDLLARGQERIADALTRLGEDELSKEIPVGNHKRTLGERLFFLYFHETYHVGQTELHRQISGKNDKVI